MQQIKQQTFNDGVVKIYEIGNAALPGDMPKEGLTLKQTLRYKERTVGYNRYYVALQHNVKADLIIRCQRVNSVQADNVAILNDGNQYRIEQVQYPEDAIPPVMDLTLERLGEIYDIS